MINYVIYTVGYLVSFLFSRMGHDYCAGIVLGAVALILYILIYRQSKSIVDLKGLFSASWIGGQGIACLQLSTLQTDWNVKTWICFYLAYVGFCAGYDFMMWRKEKEKAAIMRPDNFKEIQARTLYICMAGLVLASVACFALEAVVVGFIPLFSELPHAYSYFHVSGVHYFTVSCILTPALTVVYCKLNEQWNALKIMGLCLFNVIAVAIPVLCVSRFQLIFAVGFGLITYVLVYEKITWKMIVTCMILMIPAYALLTVARNHDVAYLNGIFAMKDTQTPIFVTQPYMYIANNYENFNCMVEQLAGHTYGIRMLFPVWALTGLKFVFPSLISSTVFVTKKELTTLTFLYDSYYDFGVIGVVCFVLVLGIVAALLTKHYRNNHNPITALYYGQIAVYFSLSFFTTWFSNPTTWFWLAITTLIYLCVEVQGRMRKEKKNG